MRTAYYCQHVLGIGHFHRSLEICRAFGKNHDVQMIVGGPLVPVTDPAVSFVQLEPLRMNEQFKNLEPCKRELDLETVKNDRREKLLDFISDYKPDCFVIELYPFGRKAFRFELDPLLEHLTSSCSPCRIYCSLRDILVEKTEGHEKFEQRAVDTLNKYFTGLLIHADKEIISLEQTFSKTRSIRTPIHYTGFISPKPSLEARTRIRKKHNITARQKLIVASIGGGSVGHELLFAAADAMAHLQKDGGDYLLQIFTGPYVTESTYHRLIEKKSPWLRVERFSDNFIDWLAAADLSLSMAGYNTSMNTIAAGVPALMYPFDQNQEQGLRITTLAEQSQLHLLTEKDLTPKNLAVLIEKTVQTPFRPSTINLDGAEQTLQIIESELKP